MKQALSFRHSNETARPLSHAEIQALRARHSALESQIRRLMLLGVAAHRSLDLAERSIIARAQSEIAGIRAKLNQ